MRRYILLAAAVALAALSCDETTTEPEPNPPLANSSPKNVLYSVEISFNRRDLKALTPALSRNFVFHFDPDDVGQSPPGSNYIIPGGWTYTDFTGAVGNMFENAHSISLAINKSVVETPGESETTFKAENITINLLVMIDELNGFRAGDYGYCNFEFERYDAQGGEKLWRLTNWWDRTAQPLGDAAAGGRPSSLGKVLSLYR